MAETLAQVTMRILPRELECLSAEQLARIEKAIADESPAITAAARAQANSPEDAKHDTLKMALDLRRKLMRAA